MKLTSYKKKTKNTNTVYLDYDYQIHFTTISKGTRNIEFTYLFNSISIIFLYVDFNINLGIIQYNKLS